MKFPSRETVEKVRREYPIGCRVELVRMDDVQAPPIGTKGTVMGVDDVASVMVDWDNGSSLNVIHGEDICRRTYEGGERVTIERAIEILDPEHREHYDSLEVVDEACRMGIEALEKQLPKKPVQVYRHNFQTCKDKPSKEFCPTCYLDMTGVHLNFCPWCGQRMDWSDYNA